MVVISIVIKFFEVNSNGIFKTTLFFTDSDFVITVTSTTNPPLKLGSSVELNCSINPDPSVGRPVQLYYTWSGNDGQFYSSSSSPNVTTFLTVTHYKASYYYCEVSVRGYVIGVGSIVIGVGSILIETEGKISIELSLLFT